MKTKKEKTYNSNLDSILFKSIACTIQQNQIYDYKENWKFNFNVKVPTPQNIELKKNTSITSNSQSNIKKKIKLFKKT